MKKLLSILIQSQERFVNSSSSFCWISKAGCIQACADDPSCNYFSFKASLNCGYLLFLTHEDWILLLRAATTFSFFSHFRVERKKHFQSRSKFSSGHQQYVWDQCHSEQYGLFRQMRWWALESWALFLSSFWWWGWWMVTVSSGSWVAGQKTSWDQKHFGGLQGIIWHKLHL